MKYFKLMTNTSQALKGGLYTLQAKHELMFKLSFQEQRTVLWETVSDTETPEQLDNYVTFHSVLFH